MKHTFSEVRIIVMHSSDSLQASERSAPVSPRNPKTNPLITKRGHRTTKSSENVAQGRITVTTSLDAAELQIPDPDHPPLSSESLRMRANTAPVDLSRERSVDIKPRFQQKGPVDLLSSSSSSNDVATTIVKKPSEDDEEMKRATAMALAIQNNPNMTPDEIRGLLANETDQIATMAAASAAQSLLIPGRLTNLISGISTNAASISGDGESITAAASSTMTETSTAKPASGKVSFRERARGKFNDLITGSAKPLSPEAIGGGDDTTSRKESPPDSSASMRRPFRHGNKQAARTPPISPNPTDSPAIVMAPNAVPSVPLETQQNPESKPAPIQKKSAPIRISGVAWKRRGGMGKFSTTAAWERRRIELQGTKLLYYQRDALEEQQDDSISPSSAVATSEEAVLSSMTARANALATSAASEEPETAEGVVVVPKRANWLEQATSSWTSPPVEDPTTARGFIDLTKEKATVHAAYGHSGAPSPFAISIKVRGETKWKLCFDYQKTQMEWLAAMTDVVVQNSVDSYNALLLQSVDPANQTEHALFQPPSVAEPPTTADGVHRLWQTDPYVVCSQHGDIIQEESETVDDNEDDWAADGSSSEHHEPSSGSVDSETQKVIADASSKTWTIPENNILYVVGVLNVSLAYARASSTSMEGFWYLVVLANLGVYLCLTKEPHWRSILVQTHLLGGIKLANNPGWLKKRKARGKGDSSPTKSTASAKPKVAGYIPVAGCSTVQLETPTDPPVNSKNEHFAGWRPNSGEDMMIRSHGYLTSKAKVPSPGELYELIDVDVFESPHRYPDMGPRVRLPKVEFNDSVEQQKTWRAPDIFIVSIALPTDPPSLGRQTSDGGGYTITMYFRMKQETRDILKRVTSDGYDRSKEQVEDPQNSQVNAVRLFDNWCRRAPTDDKFQARFKVVPNAHNLKEIGMPGWIAKYNGKPFLIKRPGQTGFLFSHPELSCMEFDISLHPFPYLAKQAICFMKDKFFKKVLVTFGFVIEGRSDDEVKIPNPSIAVSRLCLVSPLLPCFPAT